jgi:hypothetical protein
MLDRKAEVINFCIENLMEKAKLAKEEMDSAQKSANDYGQPKDRYDSFRAKTLANRDMYAKQFEKLVSEIKVLQGLLPVSKLNKVDFGALVHTNANKIFISIGIGKINLKNESYMVISPNVPIFNAMKSLKLGDEFTFNGKKFKITELV